jgi:hypothetical protein
MKKILLSLSLVLVAFSVNAQTETIIQDFNMNPITDQASYNAAIAQLNGGAVSDYTKWAFDNGSGFYPSLSYTATATNTAGAAGFAVGEKLVYCTNFGQYANEFQGKIPVDENGVAASDSIDSFISTRAQLLATKSYKVKFDVSPRRNLTEYFDVLVVFMYQKNATTGDWENVKIINSKQFVNGDYGKKTVQYDLPVITADGDYYIGFEHVVTDFAADVKFDPTVAVASAKQGGILLDKIRLVETVLSNDEFFSSKFSVSPNPANSVINIANADNMLVNGVTVTDLNGRTVKNVSFEGVASAQVNVSDLASGMYILNVTSDKGTATKKFVKN